MTTTEGFVRTDSFVPLPPDPVIIVIPDSPEGLCSPPVVIPAEPAEPAESVPVEVPVPAAPPARMLPPAEPPARRSAPAPERESLLDSEYFWISLWVAKYLCYAGIAWIVGYNVLYPIYGFLAWVIGVAAAAGGSLLVTALLVAGAWQLVSRMASSAKTVAPQPKAKKLPAAVVRPSKASSKPSRQVAAAPSADGLTARWVAKMRDPQSQQIYGGLAGDDPSTGVYNGRCAGGWGLEAAGGINKKNMHRMERQYGLPFLRNVARMNDKGVPLSEIADYVERKTR